MLLYYITDRTQLSSDPRQQVDLLISKIVHAAHCGLDMVQIRGKDLSVRDLEKLALQVMAALKESGVRSATRIFINSRTDVALAVGADGVHLRSHSAAGEISVAEARAIALRAGRQDLLIGASCHNIDDVISAESGVADFVVFGPVFGKSTAPSRQTAFSQSTATGEMQAPGERPPEIAHQQQAVGLESLRTVCHRLKNVNPRLPVLALGGVSIENAASCIEAGAAGVAGIRLFQKGNLEETVRNLRILNLQP